MPIQKMRDISEVTPPAAVPLQGGNIRSAIELSQTLIWLKPSNTIRGVERYASLEQARSASG